MKIHWRLINKYIKQASKECHCNCKSAIEDENKQCFLYVSCGPTPCENPCNRCLFWTGHGEEDRKDMK